MYKLFFKVSLFFAVPLWLFSVTGCTILVEYACIAGRGEIDLSNDFSRGHVIGKEYETLQKTYLTQFKDSTSLNIEENLVYTYDKNGSKIESNVYSKIKIIPKGTRFRVYKVLASTGFGSELCGQNILANLINDQGTTIPIRNFQRTRSLIKVKDLFENTHEGPYENWVFRPKCELIKEIR